MRLDWRRRCSFRSNPGTSGILDSYFRGWVCQFYRRNSLWLVYWWISIQVKRFSCKNHRSRNAILAAKTPKWISARNLFARQYSLLQIQGYLSIVGSYNAADLKQIFWLFWWTVLWFCDRERWIRALVFFGWCLRDRWVWRFIFICVWIRTRASCEDLMGFWICGCEIPCR